MGCPSHLVYASAFPPFGGEILEMFKTERQSINVLYNRRPGVFAHVESLLNRIGDRNRITEVGFSDALTIYEKFGVAREVAGLGELPRGAPTDAYPVHRAVSLRNIFAYDR